MNFIFLLILPMNNTNTLSEERGFNLVAGLIAISSSTNEQVPVDVKSQLNSPLI